MKAEVLHRAADISDDIAFVLDHEADCSYMTDLLAAGKLPLRVTHNDTKLNNILLDADTNDALCIIDLELFEAYTKGFLEVAGNTLTPLEIETLPWGAKLMTLECGMRFLTDYLEGDHYFAIHRPGQNLDRARTQFKLVRDMEACWSEMNNIVSKYSK